MLFIISLFCLLLFISIIETRSYYDGMVRLIPSGSYPYRGRLEVVHYRRWGTVCHVWFTHASADVACRQMGLQGGWRLGRYRERGFCRNLDGRYMCGRGRIWLDHVSCWGGESRIKDCWHLPWGWHACNHHHDVMLHCMSPPLWNVEWDYGDEPDAPSQVTGVRASYVLFFKRTYTPNFLNKCWPMWKAQENLKIKIYPDNTDEKEVPDYLKKPELAWWSWVVGWISKPWYNAYVHVTVRGEHCDLEKIYSVSCGDNAEIPIDIQKSYCWEYNPPMPADYSMLVQKESDSFTNNTLITKNNTLSNQNVIKSNVTIENNNNEKYSPHSSQNSVLVREVVEGVIESIIHTDFWREIELNHY